MSAKDYRFFDNRYLLWLLGALLLLGFAATAGSSYWVSRQAIREAILGKELPLAANNIYMEIQKDLVRPVLLSSTMASDTFARDWVLGGEKDPQDMARYLAEVRTRYGAFSSFFVSERTGNYYTADGIFKQVRRDEPRDAWYWRVRDMKEPYEINVDFDMANKDAMTIFVNYRMLDYQGRYLGAVGLGLTIDAVYRLMKDYQQRYARDIYFVNARGQQVLSTEGPLSTPADLRARAGLGPLLDSILAADGGGYQYNVDGHTRLLNVHRVPELHWYLFVEKDEAEALAGIRRALWINLLICVLITAVVLSLTRMALARYHRRLEEAATRDKLTGLYNRHAFAILQAQLKTEIERNARPLSVLLMDVDHFKQINDRYGHAAGDLVLARLAQLLQDALRKSDMAVRWGGEEFLVILQDCPPAQAQALAEKLRATVERAEFLAAGQRISVTLSVGVGERQPGEAMEQTLGRADARLYDAKHAGRNRVCVAPPDAGT